MYEITKFIETKFYVCSSCNTEHVSNSNFGKCSFCGKEICRECGDKNLELLELYIDPGEYGTFLREEVKTLIESYKKEDNYHSLDICPYCYEKIKPHISELPQT